MTSGMPPARAPWRSVFRRGAPGAWVRRVGAAPPLLALALALPPPRGASLAGLPSLCGFRRLTGLPCPGCGITRSVVCCAHGLWADAVAYHPLGPLVFATLIGLTLTGLASAIRGGARTTLPPPLVRAACWAGVASLVLIWGARLAGALPVPP